MGRDQFPYWDRLFIKMKNRGSDDTYNNGEILLKDFAIDDKH